MIIMFEKTLTDVVKGIRASKRDTALYISQCIAEIKTEISSSDMYVKANALEKLTFLQMMGYDMSWASFATIEVMSSPRFAHKRIGYLSASQGFTQDTDVILLTTNLLKKELRGAIGGSMTGVYEAALAVNCISNIVTEELAQDLLPELTNLTSHPQPYLRKKAILCLYKLFVKYPQGLRLTFAQIQQCLGDSNPAVVSCAVNVITELSDKNPRNYLHLAPAFFDLLTTSSNNWMLIKVVKLLGSLVPEEPRLARKLLEPLAGIVRNTPAKSLLYEAVHAITLCLPYCRKSDGSMPVSVPDIVALCAQTLKEFVEEKDQNLNYLGLVGFGSLMQSHPKVLSAPAYRPLILACLSDEDVTIRSRALGLLPSMTTRKNLVELVTQLLRHVELASGSYKLELVAKIVEMCSAEKYAMLQSFTWYLDTLLQLGHMRGLDAHAELLRSQVTDIALRVLPVRGYAVKRSIEVLLEGEQTTTVPDTNIDGDNGRGKHIMPEVLPALAWIVGEYSDLFPEAVSLDSDAVYIYNNDSEGPYHSVIQAVSAPSNSVKLPATTQQVYVQAGMKVFAAAAVQQQVSDAELEACARTLSLNLQVYVQSTDVEVQGRAFSSYILLQSLGLDSSSDAPPGLLSLGNDGDDSDDESNKPEDSNLLEMMGSPSTAAKSKKPKNASGSMDTTGLAARCRSVSHTLNSVFKPSPMKPTGSKAQRKKHQMIQEDDAIEYSAPVDVSIFSSLIQEENALRASSRLSMESVSFTQQRPLHVSEHKSMDAVSSADFSGASGEYNMGGPQGSAGTSFQMMSGAGDSPSRRTNTTTRPQTASDPFYLNSGPAILDTDDTPNLPSRFGAIELGDGDSDDEEDAARNKKKKKKKKEKKAKAASPAANVFDQQALNQSFGSVTVYDSEDEDDEPARVPPSSKRGGRKSGKEYSGLAKVDLTMPLREDEVMPERKHHVVAERSQFEAAETNHSTGKQKKKKKESKRSKKSSKRQQAEQSAPQDAVGDLLGLGSFDPMAATPSSFPPSATMGVQPSAAIMQNSGSAISNAFDDLLGYSDPAPAAPTFIAPPPPTSTPSNFPAVSASPASKSGKRPWVRATIKISHASGSPVVDWSKVQLSFRVYRSNTDGPVSASIACRVDNHMEMSGLTGLTLRLKGAGDVHIGDVAPGSSAVCPKVGPFLYDTPDAALELKGSLVTPECNVPVKLHLPVTMHISPVDGLSLDDVYQQLSSSTWPTHSAKLSISQNVHQDKLKPLVCQFLRMAEVDPSASGPYVGTFAGQSATGAQVRVMLKAKNESLKVDIKCTNNELGKAIASDLKRMVL
jgi:AP-3 complex subunit delta-1